MDERLKPVTSVLRVQLHAHWAGNFHPGAIDYFFLLPLLQKPQSNSYSVVMNVQGKPLGLTCFSWDGEWASG